MPNHARYIDNPYVVEGETNPTCKFPAKDDLDALVARIGRRVDYTRPDVYVGESIVLSWRFLLINHRCIRSRSPAAAPWRSYTGSGGGGECSEDRQEAQIWMFLPLRPRRIVVSRRCG